MGLDFFGRDINVNHGCIRNPIKVLWL